MITWSIRVFLVQGVVVYVTHLKGGVRQAEEETG